MYDLAPMVGRMVALQHLAKHAVGVIAAIVVSLGVFIIPGVRDHLGARGSERRGGTAERTWRGTNACDHHTGCSLGAIPLARGLSGIASNTTAGR